MTLTRKEQKQLIDKINDIMSDSNVILSRCESGITAQAIGHIIDSIGIILNHINNAEEEPIPVDKEN